MGVGKDSIMDYVYEEQSTLVFRLHEFCLDIDADWFVEAYLNSGVRAQLDSGNPRYTKLTAPELYREFCSEIGGQPKFGTQKAYPRHVWLVEFYTALHNITRESTLDLMDKFSLSQALSIYPFYKEHAIDAAECVSKNIR